MEEVLAADEEGSDHILLGNYQPFGKIFEEELLPFVFGGGEPVWDSHFGDAELEGIMPSDYAGKGEHNIYDDEFPLCEGEGGESSFY